MGIKVAFIFLNLFPFFFFLINILLFKQNLNIFCILT